MNKKTVEINISGIVQGVGFRPYLFNLARNFGLKGFILNRGNAGVRLVVQGDNERINRFIENIEKKSPKISYIESLETKELLTEEIFSELNIKKSEKGRGISLTLPPDIAICDDCLKDMRDSKLAKYYMYPFIACAVCGPRYTTVKELPYDRERSTMIQFPFCRNANPSSCIQEYSDFSNRRFHAQTFACSVCGPNYSLYNKSRDIIEKDSIKEILKLSAKRIKKGEVAAVKGIGGVHLVCLADNDDIILKLRKRKGERKYKPFALMVPNLDLVEDFLKISQKERELLTSFRRPIVLLEKKNDETKGFISKQVAPGLNNIGVMLPYSGIHYLLFDFIGEKPLVYTSGNKSNIPMGIENDTIFDQLEHLADFFLLHNRTIHQRADDSVVRIHDNKVKLIRRSRGYVPEYIPLPFNVDVSAALATGPELSTTGAVLRRNRIFPTQHIGNVTHLETYDFLKNALFHMKNLLQIKDSEVEFITCDAHPTLITSKFAQELSMKYNIPFYPVQHHFAHALGLMADNKVEIEESIVAISTDGVGYGDDGNVWGGEILLCSYKGYKRFGHLEYQPMIGGDRCTKYPARMAASIILKNLGIEDSLRLFEQIELSRDLEYGQNELQTLISQYETSNNRYLDGNIPLSSSTGRIFDTVSYLLGASNIKTYRGEPAMRLEGLAANGNPDKIKLDIKCKKKNNTFVINTSDLILDILRLKKNPCIKPEDIGASFHKALANSFAEIAIIIAQENHIKNVGLTGGVAFNYFFSRSIKEKITKEGLLFLEHNKVSPGDAGISTGQLIGGLFKHNLENS